MISSIYMIAVDNNNLAIETARKNAALNEVEEKIEFYLGEAKDFLHKQTDLLCANLYYSAINQLMDQEQFFTKKWYILSGLLASEEGVIEKRLLEEAGTSLVETIGNQGWFTLVAWSHKSIQGE